MGHEMMIFKDKNLLRKKTQKYYFKFLSLKDFYFSKSLFEFNHGAIAQRSREFFKPCLDIQAIIFRIF